MAALLKKLSTMASPAVNALRESTHDSRFPIGAAAAVAGGVAFYYYYSSPPVVAQLEAQVDKTAEKVALESNKWYEFKLQHTERVSHNTQLFRFSIDPDAKLGLNVASFILTSPAGENRRRFMDRFLIRPYTPISDPDAKGYFELLIKIYPKGKMSQHFASLKPGDAVKVRGPIQTLSYAPNMKKKIGMIAGGAGITPMLQVIRTILKNPNDNTQVSLVYSNTSPDDILLKAELDRLASSHPNFKVFYTVSKPSENWTGGIGHVSKDMVVKELPGPGEDTLILVCGPPGFMDHVSGNTRMVFQGKLSGLLKELGYTKQMVHKF